MDNRSDIQHCQIDFMAAAEDHKSTVRVQGRNVDTLMDGMVREQIPGMDAHFFTLTDDFMMGIIDSALLDGQADVPGNVVAKLCLLLANLFGTPVKAVVA